jgi:hypothetical protein
MLQRIQTVWLFLATLCAILGFKFSFYSGAMMENDVSLKFKLIDAGTNIYLIITTTVIAVVSTLAIFLYKNRGLQLKLCILGIIIELVAIFFYYIEVKKFDAYSGTYSLTALIQAGVIIFFYLAAMGIRKDQKIIKESNRLR